MNSSVYEAEKRKLTALFDAVDPAKRALVEGLIHDAAFLYAQNTELRELLEKTGMVRCHPQRCEMQKPVEAAKQYRNNIGMYAVAIKALNSVLSKDAVEQDDDFDAFMKKHQEQGDG